MIYFLTALYYEAENIILHYKMKKVMEVSKFQVFKGENEVLIISGTGCIKSVAAATYLLNYFEYSDEDIFVNLGICGSVRSDFNEGQLFLCNKLFDSFSKKSFYPDMLFKHPFNEGTLESFHGNVCKDALLKLDTDIVDEEGAFVYQAVSIFLKPHNIHIIKIVSDILNPDSVTPQKIEKLMNDNMPEVYNWLENRIKMKTENKDAFSEEEYNIIETLSERMKLTTAMNMKLLKLSRQYKIRNGNVIDIIKENTKFQCESKNEGKKIFGELKKRLMEL